MKAVVSSSFILLTFFIESSEVLYDAKHCGLKGTRSHRSVPEVTVTESKSAKRDDGGHLSEYEVESNATNEDEDDPMQHTVMGGERVSMGELPWTVLIHLYNGTEDDEYSFESPVPITTYQFLIRSEFTTSSVGRSMHNVKATCSGTLMTGRHIVTAAHCFQKSGDKDCEMEDMLDLDTALKYGEIMVAGVCQMVNKTVKCTKKDVGQIMKIKSHICLPHLHNLDDLDVSSKKYFAAGWGADPRRKLESTPRLNKINLGRRLTNTECLKIESSKGLDAFCTLDTEEKNVCRGDSGSGVIAKHEGKHYIFGLLSYGTVCEDIMKKKELNAEVHTDISFYTAEIDKFIGAKVKNRESIWKGIIEKHPEDLNIKQLKEPEFTNEMGPLTTQTTGLINVFLLIYYYVNYYVF
ncbi:hypothetical protein GCK32_004563 [Trichostrongylus colubriformis]|uniref:Peptidase S1 domain-containing protein n=1 Tax=Trichostrongylus colubriformis TaxID=6319 RepID=A0AAN8F9A2_TRICO